MFCPKSSFLDRSFDSFWVDVSSYPIFQHHSFCGQTDPYGRLGQSLGHRCSVCLGVLWEDSKWLGPLEPTNSGSLAYQRNAWSTMDRKIKKNDFAKYWGDEPIPKISKISNLHPSVWSFCNRVFGNKTLRGVSDSQGTVPQNLNRNYSRMFRLGTWNTWNTWNGISCFNHLEMCLIFHGMEPEMECVWSYEILWYPHGSQQESIHGPAVLSPSIRKSPRRDGTEFRLRFSWLNDCLDMWI